MSLSEVYHQADVQRTIQRAVRTDRLAHAYLFHGPDGVGKETLAIGLAELLLCPQPVDRTLDDEQASSIGLDALRSGCGACEDCRAVAMEAHPDLHMIFRQLSRQHPDSTVRKRKAIDIGVDVMRQFVIERVARTPVRGLAKVFIVREADRITPQAQNALLKTLEEPPGATVIVLLVTSLKRLLPTTLSRCQLVRFDALPTTFVTKKLADMFPDQTSQQGTWYAARSEGSLGRAVSGVHDALFELNEQLIDSFAVLASDAPGDSKRRSPAVGNDEIVKRWTEASKSLGERYRKRDSDISDTEATRRGLKTIFQLAAQWYGDILRASCGETSAIVNGEHRDAIARAAATIGPRASIEAVRRLAQSEHHLDRNVYAPLCVETLVNDLVSLASRSVAPAA